MINYEKPENVIANISLNLDKRKDDLKIKKFQLNEQKSSIILENILIKKNKFISLKNISIKTFKKDKINNDFEILFGKKYILREVILMQVIYLSSLTKKVKIIFFPK